MASSSSSTAGSSNPAKGYACVVRRNWNARELKGDYVWVFSTNQGYGFTQLPSGNSILSGWVPLHILEKGKERVNPLPIELISQAKLLQQGAPQTAESENVLQETIRSFWQNIKSNEAAITAALPGMSERSKGVLFSSATTQYADYVYSCIVPQARAIMANGRFSVTDLRTLPSVSASYPKQPGIYLIIYWDFGERTLGSRKHVIAIYIGQTVDFVARLASHKSSAITSANTSSQHYRLAAQAEHMVMVPLILQADGQVPPENFLDIAEFTMVCLFKSWFAALYNPNDTNAVGAYANDFDACIMFSRLVDQVRASTGWALDLTYGLNWNTPIVKNASKEHQWTAWYDTAKEMHVYRTRRNVWAKATPCLLSLLGPFPPDLVL